MSALPSASAVSLDERLAVDAARRLYELHGRRIFRFCLSRLGSREDAEDATQNTFLNAFRALQRGVVPEYESTWLLKIAENACKERRRSAWRRGRIETPRDPSLMDDTAQAPAAVEDGLGVAEALARLCPTQRQALVLRELEGLSYKEIARELAISQSAVETLLFRARHSLAQRLEEGQAAAARLRRRGLEALSSLGAGVKWLAQSGSTAKVAAVVVAAGTAGTLVGETPRSKHVHAPPERHVPATPGGRSVARAPAPQGRAPSSGKRNARAPRRHTDTQSSRHAGPVAPQATAQVGVSASEGDAGTGASPSAPVSAPAGSTAQPSAPAPPTKPAGPAPQAPQPPPPAVPSATVPLPSVPHVTSPATPTPPLPPELPLPPLPVSPPPVDVPTTPVSLP